MARRKALTNAIKRRNARRLWNHLVAKLSSKTIDDLPLEEDAWDRHERHMKPIKEARKHSDY